MVNFQSKVSDEGIGDIITASTQTAVVLAELAVDDTNILDVTDIQNTQNVVDLQASGFCMEEMVLHVRLFSVFDFDLYSLNRKLLFVIA